MPSQQPANLSFSVRKQQEWGSFKDEIRQLYMVQDMTLKQTIEKIKDNHGINAKSILKLKERTWKKKLVEEWGFEKYVPANEMEFIVSKSEKRSREDGKETVFFRGEIQITSESERIVHFKRRKLTHAAATALDSAETPPNITYHTPESAPESPEHDGHDSRQITPEIEKPHITCASELIVAPNNPSTSVVEKRVRFNLSQNTPILNPPEGRDTHQPHLTVPFPSSLNTRNEPHYLPTEDDIRLPNMENLSLAGNGHIHEVQVLINPHTKTIIIPQEKPAIGLFDNAANSELPEISLSFSLPSEEELRKPSETTSPVPNGSETVDITKERIIWVFDSTGNPTLAPESVGQSIQEEAPEENTINGQGRDMEVTASSIELTDEEELQQYLDELLESLENNRGHEVRVRARSICRVLEEAAVKSSVLPHGDRITFIGALEKLLEPSLSERTKAKLAHDMGASLRKRIGIHKACIRYEVSLGMMFETRDYRNLAILFYLNAFCALMEVKTNTSWSETELLNIVTRMQQCLKSQLDVDDGWSCLQNGILPLHTKLTSSGKGTASRSQTMILLYTTAIAGACSSLHWYDQANRLFMVSATQSSPTGEDDGGMTAVLILLYLEDSLHALRQRDWDASVSLIDATEQAYKELVVSFNLNRRERSVTITVLKGAWTRAVNLIPYSRDHIGKEKFDVTMGKLVQIGKGLDKLQNEERPLSSLISKMNLTRIKGVFG